MSPELPIVAAAALVGLWLALFFLGATAGGWIHVLPAAAIVLVVRSLRGARASARRGGDFPTGEKKR